MSSAPNPPREVILCDGRRTRQSYFAEVALLAFSVELALVGAPPPGLRQRWRGPNYRTVGRPWGQNLRPFAHPVRVAAIVGDSANRVDTPTKCGRVLSGRPGRGGWAGARRRLGNSIAVLLLTGARRAAKPGAIWRAPHGDSPRPSIQESQKPRIGWLGGRRRRPPIPIGRASVQDIGHGDCAPFLPCVDRIVIAT